MSNNEELWDYWFELDTATDEWVQRSTVSRRSGQWLYVVNECRTRVDRYSSCDAGCGVLKFKVPVYTHEVTYYEYRGEFIPEAMAVLKKHTFDDAKDWESYYSQPIEPPPTVEDFHQLGHPPQCDCGAEKANTTHARWCSKGNL